MLKLITQNRFEREAKKIKKRGKDMEKLKEVIKLLQEGKPLPPKYRNHKLRAVNLKTIGNAMFNLTGF